MALPSYHLGLLELLGMQARDQHLARPPGAVHGATNPPWHEEEDLRDEH